MINKKKFEQDLQVTIEKCKKELIERKNGILGDCSVVQLENFIIPELEKYLLLSIEGKLPNKKDRALISAWLLIDSGIRDMNKLSDMAEMILKIDKKYFS